MKNERVDASKFVEMLYHHYENLWDMGMRDLSWPQYPNPIHIWKGKRVIHCEHSSEVILYGGCEYCRNNSLTSLDENSCCMTCSAPVEM